MDEKLEHKKKIALNSNSYNLEREEQIKIKVLMQWDIEDIATKEIDPEEDFFKLGLLQTHGLIDGDMHLTEQGQKEFERIGKEMIAEQSESVKYENRQIN